MGLFDKVSLFSFKVFRRPAGRLARTMPTLREDLLRSNMRVTPVGLISVAFLATLSSALVVTGIVAWALSSGFTILLLLVIVPPVVFAFTLNTPKFSASSRASAVDNELPLVVGYMSILAGGGLSLIETLRRIADLQIFPAAAKEAKRILIDIDALGRDPLTALDWGAKYTPSRSLSDLLAGYTTVLRTGGDYVNFLNVNLKEIFEAREAKIKRTTETTGAVAESFLIVTVVLGIALFTLYLVETLIDNNGSGLASLYFFSFIIVPVLSAGFTWLIDVVQPKWPYTDMRPYKIFLAFVPVGLIVFAAPLPLKLSLHLAVSLIAITVVPTYFAEKYARQRRGVEKMLPDFIKDVSEGRKIGLPPEESIERLGDRNYRQLTPYVAKMGAQLSWGIQLGKVISTFAKTVNSWIAKAVGTLMLEVVEIGGGTTKGFTEMADFTRKISEMESERRSVLRSYVFIAYIGGLMLVMTTFMMIFLLAEPAAKGLSVGAVAGIIPSTTTIDTLLAAGIFECWVIGLVAGKMGEGSVAEGFKHALILVILNLVLIFGARLFISFPL
ncbi:MAG TPA: type II secretion system F family protein [Nitrososphaerales archaeon]|nr:type II secretion system F family protein [Nitrososphaerales archaeon]